MKSEGQRSDFAEMILDPEARSFTVCEIERPGAWTLGGERGPMQWGAAIRNRLRWWIRDPAIRWGFLPNPFKR